MHNTIPSVPDVAPQLINLFIIEQQEISRLLYQTIFTFPHSPARAIGIQTPDDYSQIYANIQDANPDILVIGVPRLDNEMIARIDDLRTKFPSLGLVLIIGAYNFNGLIQIKQLVRNTGCGFAVLLKQTMDKVDQLFSAISAVKQGQTIIDPALAGAMFSDDSDGEALKSLTGRELEILGLLARGYTNSAIAETLSIDIKTVRHHINSMYSKLKSSNDMDSQHPRVAVTRLYLKSTGQLVAEAD